MGKGKLIEFLTRRGKKKEEEGINRYLSSMELTFFSAQ
jgi:hypothetical protein